ncbi:MAG TPA: patatin-like phospholipase family protein [Burkholderiales bacterium]|nr:patatin-like phospholipase family protein [Burkholderiales bacterium]
MSHAVHQLSLIFLVLLAVASGCGDAPRRIYVRDSLPQGYSLAALSQANRDKLVRNPQHEGPNIELPLSRAGLREADDLPFMREWEWNKDTENPPAVCLALSGGGVRSAAFSIGVLEGLYKKGYLQKVDVLSGVSGGSYALSWYYVQQYLGWRKQHENAIEDTREKMFDEKYDDNPFQKHLERHASVIEEELEVVPLFLLGLPLAIGNLAVNGAFGWHQNTTLVRPYYQGKLSATFHTDPYGHQGGKTSLYELGQFAKKDKLPFFIINSTVLYDDDITSEGTTLANKIFEFTPLQYGSDGFGRYLYRDGEGVLKSAYDDVGEISVGLATAISGAAVDLPSLLSFPAQKTLGTALNFDLGYYLDNPAVPRAARILHKFIPFPFYFSHHYARDISGVRLYLTDGGHSENLGVFGLVRRLCKEIVVVDGEHDPYYNFGSYQLLKRALKREMGVDLVVQKIDDAIKYLDVPYGTLTIEEMIDRTASGRKRPETGMRWKFFAENPVVTGKICCLPYPGRRDEKITVKYVKLAYGSDRDAGCKHKPYWRGSAADFIGDECYCREDDPNNYFCCVIEERDNKLTVLYPFGISEPFPQQPTRDQDFNWQQFRAYRVLGREIIRKSSYFAAQDHEDFGFSEPPVGAYRCRPGQQLLIDPSREDTALRCKECSRSVAR